MSPEPHDSFPEAWDTFQRNGETYGRTDTDKEFKLTAGATEPQNGRCGAPLTDYERRYGEIRYCTQMPESTFVDDGSDFCKTHKSMDSLLDRGAELVSHGAFAQNYIVFAQSMDVLKFIVAIEMFDGLLQQSRHEFDIEYEQRAIDTSDSEFIADTEVTVDLPFPNDTMLSFQYNELWLAALDEVKMQNMQHIIFDDGVSRKTIAQSADMEGKITDVKYESQEHHLHMSMSRLTTDIKDHLKNGGVAIDDGEDGSVVTFQKNDYTLDVGEETDDDVEMMSAEEFTKDLQDDSAEVTIE